MNNEKFEKLNNDQKELVKYWIEKLAKEAKSSIVTIETRSFTEKYLKPEFNPKVGTWYISIDNEGNEYLFNHQEEGTSYGFFKGVWNNTYWDTSCNWTNNPREATPEEVKQRLIEEAKIRGFVKGAKFHPIFNEKENTRKEICICNGNFFSNTPDKLSASISGLFGQLIMKDGKWAEIIDEKADIRESVAKLEAELKELKSKL